MSSLETTRMWTGKLKSVFRNQKWVQVGAIYRRHTVFEQGHANAHQWQWHPIIPWCQWKLSWFPPWNCQFDGGYILIFSQSHTQISYCWSIMSDYIPIMNLHFLVVSVPNMFMNESLSSPWGWYSDMDNQHVRAKPYLRPPPNNTQTIL